MTKPSFEDLFAVMSAASVGDGAARVAIPDDPQLDDTPTRFGIALNLLLDDLALRAAEAHAVHEERLRSIELDAMNRRVQEASRLKSEFLANMSHELRTPLNSIIGFGELLRDGEVGPLQPTQEEFLGHIVASSKHLLQLINDILDLSKVEAGKMSFAPEPVAPATVVGEVVAIMQSTAATGRVRLTTRIDERLELVVLDVGRFKQVLYNYVSNAIKFTPRGGHVEVRLTPEEPDRFRIEVEDTGIGIAPEDLDRLFIEFQQLDASVTKSQGGTGLGLALTRRLVEAQGGSVGVRSTVGKGSVFHAVLPIGRIATSAPELRTAAPSARDAPAVLVVEDAPEDRRAIVDALESAGYQVDSAATAREAIAKCGDRSYDALTLDLLLPDGSGLDVLEAVRVGDRNRDVKIVVVTIVAEPGAVAGFVVNDILRKPCDPAALVAALERAGVRPAPREVVYVVDDDARSLKLVSATLEPLGIEIACYPDGHTALAMLEQRIPAAVVLDLLMPGMDGFEFLDRFRALPACRTVPVIVWTVKDLSAAEHQRLRATAQAIVTKGSGHASLVRALETHLPMRSIQPKGG